MVEQPKRLLVVGGGPIGCELGQGFARIGTKVVIANTGKRILKGDDAEGAKMVQD